MNKYTVYIVEHDGRTEHMFEMRGKSANELQQMMKKMYPGAVVIRVWASSGEESKEVKGYR